MRGKIRNDAAVDTNLSREDVENFHEASIPAVQKLNETNNNICVELCLSIARQYGITTAGVDPEVEKMLSNLRSVTTRSIHKLAAELYSQVSNGLRFWWGTY